MVHQREHLVADRHPHGVDAVQQDLMEGRRFVAGLALQKRHQAVQLRIAKAAPTTGCGRFGRCGLRHQGRTTEGCQRMAKGLALD
jgi:hypothetical protein